MVKKSVQDIATQVALERTRNTLSGKISQQIDRISDTLNGNFTDPSDIVGRLDTLYDLLTMLDDIPEKILNDWKLAEDKLKQSFKLNSKGVMYDPNDVSKYQLKKCRLDFTFLGRVSLDFGVLKKEAINLSE